MNDVMLDIKNLSFSYKNRFSLNNISFQIEKGQLCGLLGPNGSGKSTLFKCCLNFLQQYTGKIFINGKSIKKMSVLETARLISYVPQEHKPSFPYTVREIILMGRTPYMNSVFGLSQDDYKIVDEIINMLGIDYIADLSATEISGGQRQLVLIARAVAQNTPIMLLDEPTSALDFNNQIMIWKILKKISKQGKTVIVCSHEPNHILWFTDVVVTMYRGEVVSKGYTNQVLTEELLSYIYSGKYVIGNIDNRKIIYPEL